MNGIHFAGASRPARVHPPMSKRILIIGSGVVGLSSAYYCALRGHRTIVVEREPEQRNGCSFGNAGMIVPSHFVPLAAPGVVSTALKWMWNPRSPLYIKPRLDAELVSWGWKFMRAANRRHVERSAPLLRDLSFASRACFEELADRTDNEFGLVKRGLLMLCKTAHALEHETAFAKQANELGVPAEVLDRSALAKIDPDITMDVVGGVYFPKDCHLSPSAFMATLKRQCEGLEVEFHWSSEVEGLTCNGDRVASLRTSQAEFDFDELVLCGGSWSPTLIRGLGLKLPMQAGKGYSLTLQNPLQLPQLCSILTEARVAVTPMGGALRFGGTMEIAGLNEEINPVRIDGIVQAIPRYFPKFTPADFAGIQPWGGLRPCSPDGLPYLGRCSRYANLVIATGHAMMGLSLGPITGRLVAGLLNEEKPAFD